MSRLAVIVCLPENDPFMLCGRFGHLDLAVLDFIHQRADRAEIAIGAVDLAEQVPGGCREIFTDASQKAAFGLAVFMPDNAGLTMGKIHRVDLFAETGQLIR